MSGVKRKILSVSEKVQIIREIENGTPNIIVSKKYGLSASTISTIWKNRESSLSAFEKNLTTCKKLKKCDKTDVDAALLSWFKVQRSAGLPISGPILKVQAEKFAAQLGYKEFKCNNGWIDRFKNRNNIVYAKVSGEALSVDKTVVSDWIKNAWPDLKQGYADNNIYNADEAGVFYNLTPDKTFKFKNEKCIGGKLAKDRLTVLVCANMSGTDKKKLLVIGKSANPRSFKNVKRLPVDYTANKKAWMTAEIFEREIRKWDKTLDKQNRQILLLVDNCPAHSAVPNLNNIKLVFLPPNVTSVLQPMDQGVIRSFKAHFRRLLVLLLIEQREKSTINSCNVKISMLEAIRLMSDAWNSVSMLTIKNCFKKSGLLECELEELFDEEDNLPLSEWLKTRNLKDFQACEEIDNFVDIDDDVATSGLPTDTEIIRDISRGLRAKDVSDNEDSDDDIDDLATESITWTQAESALDILTKFVESRSVTTEKTFKLISDLRNNFKEIKYSCSTQTKINDFFSSAAK